MRHLASERPWSATSWGVVLIVVAGAVSGGLVDLAVHSQPTRYLQETFRLDVLYSAPRPPYFTQFDGASFWLWHTWARCNGWGCPPSSAYDRGVSGYANASGGPVSFFNMSSECGWPGESCQGQSWISPGGDLGVWWHPENWANDDYPVTIGVQSDR